MNTSVRRGRCTVNIKTQWVLSTPLTMDNTFSASIFPQNVLVNFICTEIIFLKDVPFGICNGDKMCLSLK